MDPSGKQQSERCNDLCFPIPARAIGFVALEMVLATDMYCSLIKINWEISNKNSWFGNVLFIYEVTFDWKWLIIMAPDVTFYLNTFFLSFLNIFNHNEIQLYFIDLISNIEIPILKNWTLKKIIVMYFKHLYNDLFRINFNILSFL